MRLTLALLLFPSLSFGFNMAQEMREAVLTEYPDAVVEQRTDKSIVMKTGNKYIVQSSLAPLHISGTETEINTAWETHNGTPYFRKMVTADYHAYAGLNSNVSFGAGQIIRYEHPATGEYVTFQPQDLNWTNQWDSSAFISAPQNVSVSLEGNNLYWANAYGTGRSFRWITNAGGLQKELILNSLAQLGSPPQWIVDSGGAALKLNFLFQKSAGTQIWFSLDGVEYQQWNGSTTIPTNHRIQFRKDGQILWAFNPGYAYASDGAELYLETKLMANWAGLFVQVLVPWAWLQTAAYPVVIDPTIDTQVGATGDDGLAYTGNFSTTSQSNRIGNIGGGAGNPITSFARFTGITMEGTIDTAYVSLYAAANFTNTVNARFRADDQSNPAAPTSESDLNGRTRTTAYTDWTPGNWTGSTFYNSPSMVSTIQELVDSYTFSSSSLLIIMDDNGSAANVNRTFRDYTNNSANAPKLYIEYTEGGDPEPSGGMQIWMVN